ncbi:MAG TPA: hypothetical protein DCP97_00635, partial [Ruminococcaceae bacterium]|nr:hypothetical protein [Oscillospiraceae bacterium]
MVILKNLNSDKILSPTAVALGFFDGVHLGHQRVIQNTIDCKDKGLSSCVFTFSVDHEAPASKAGFKILSTDTLKAQILENMGVEFMFCPTFEEIKNLTPEQFVADILKNTLSAQCVACGDDFHFGIKASAGVKELKELCAQHNIMVNVIGPVQEDGLNISSSRIRDYIKQGNIKKANKLLGRPYTIDFEVIQGQRLGRTMSFPTINQKLPEVYVMPKFGVYASAALIHGKMYPSG